MTEKAKDDVARQRIADLLTNCQATHTRINGNLDKIWDKLETIDEKLSRYVPPWVTVLFASGSAIITGLSVYLLTH